MWENFGGGNFWQVITDEAIDEEKIGESAFSLQLFYCIFINIGGEKFGELNTICQIFPTPKFSHVR